MNILIIEDEQLIANRLLRMCRLFFTETSAKIDHRDSVSDGLEFIEKNNIDLLLLDLNLNGQNGFEILKQVVGHAFHTIIVSAYKDKAIEAFEYGVLDFVPKPFSQKRLFQALNRTSSDSPQNSKTRVLKFLSIIKRGHQHLLEVKNLNYIKGARVYTEIYLKDGSKEVHNKSLDALLQLLPGHFERIHKSYIVDMQEVSELKAESGGKYTAFLKSGDQLPVGRTKYKGLKKKYLI